ncbi:MAG: tetratricopeptide repeat protein [Fusobacteriaceae bacterium]
MNALRNLLFILLFVVVMLFVWQIFSVSNRKIANLERNLNYEVKRREFDLTIAAAVAKQTTAERIALLQSLVRDPRYTQFLGEIYFYIGYFIPDSSPRDKIMYYDKAIWINPRDYASYHNRGLVKEKQSDYYGAIADYEKAVEINPRFAEAYNSRGLAKAFLGDIYGAIADFNKAIEYNPQFIEAINNRERINPNMINSELDILIVNGQVMKSPSYINNKAKTKQDVNLLIVNDETGGKGKTRSVSSLTRNAAALSATIKDPSARAQAAKGISNLSQLDLQRADGFYAVGLQQWRNNNLQEALTQMDNALRINPSLAGAIIARKNILQEINYKSQGYRVVTGTVPVGSQRR